MKWCYVYRSRFGGRRVSFSLPRTLAFAPDPHSPTRPPTLVGATPPPRRARRRTTVKSSSQRERVCAAKIDNGPTGTERGSVGRSGASSQVATLTMYRARTTAGGHEAAGGRWKSPGTTPLSTIVILSFPLRCRVSVIYCFSTMLQIRSVTTNYIQWF